MKQNWQKLCTILRNRKQGTGPYCTRLFDILLVIFWKWACCMFCSMSLNVVPMVKVYMTPVLNIQFVFQKSSLDVHETFDGKGKLEDSTSREFQYLDSYLKQPQCFVMTHSFSQPIRWSSSVLLWSTHFLLVQNKGISRSTVLSDMHV